MEQHVLSPAAYGELIEPLPPGLRDRLASHDKALRELVSGLGIERTRHRDVVAQAAVRVDNAERAAQTARQEAEQARREKAAQDRQLNYLTRELESARDELDILRGEEEVA